MVTSHSAFNTREAVGRIVGTTVENIKAHLAGQPRNVVTSLRRSMTAKKERGMAARERRLR